MNADHVLAPTCPCGGREFRIYADISVAFQVSPDELILEVWNTGRFFGACKAMCVECGHERQVDADAALECVPVDSEDGVLAAAAALVNERGFLDQYVDLMDH